MPIKLQTKPYPGTICSQCGMRYGKRQNYDNFIATFYPGTCGICDQECTVTEPRDYGHLNLELLRKDKIKLI